MVPQAGAALGAHMSSKGFPPLTLSGRAMFLLSQNDGTSPCPDKDVLIVAPRGQNLVLLPMAPWRARWVPGALPEPALPRVGHGILPSFRPKAGTRLVPTWGPISL